MRSLRGTLLTSVFAVGFGTTMWSTAAHVWTNLSQTDETGHHYNPAVAPLGGPAIAGLTALVVLCLVGLVVSATLFVTFVRD